MDIGYIQDKLREMGCEKVQVMSGNVMCCCPFHPERNPSFGVHPTKGANCFTCGVKFHDTDKMFQILAEKKGVEYTPIYRDLPPSFDFFPIIEPKPEPLNRNVIKMYKRDDDYFKQPDPEGWGATQEIIERRQLCIDPTSGAQCFPILDDRGQYWGMVERREIGTRRFYHYPSGYPRNSILFGEDEAFRNPGRIWVVEGPRDLVAVESKVPGSTCVALGTWRVSDEQLDKLREFDELVLALDNDEKGRLGRKRILSKMKTHPGMFIARYKGKDPMKATEFEVEDAPLGWLKVG